MEQEFLLADKCQPKLDFANLVLEGSILCKHVTFYPLVERGLRHSSLYHDL